MRIGDEELLIGVDIVLEVQGLTISTDMETMRRIRQVLVELPHGRRIDIKVLRGGKTVNLSMSK